MQLDEFLSKLFQFYPIDDESKLKFQMQEYQSTLLNETRKTGNKYDYERLFDLIKKNYRYKTLPPLPVIIDELPYCKERPIIDQSNAGKTIIVVCKRGDNHIVTDYVVSSCSVGLGELLNNQRRMYGKDNVIVRMFPRGWFHLGNKAYPPTDDDSEPVELYKRA